MVAGFSSLREPVRDSSSDRGLIIVHTLGNEVHVRDCGQSCGAGRWRWTQKDRAKLFGKDGPLPNYCRDCTEVTWRAQLVRQQYKEDQLVY